MEELTEVDAVHSNYLRTVNVAYTEVGRVERDVKAVSRHFYRTDRQIKGL